MNKAKFRENIRQKIAELDETYIHDSDLSIFKELCSMPLFLDADCVFLYHSIGREVDTRRLINFCRDNNIPFALPRPLLGGIMDFAMADGELVSGLYGIPQPSADISTAVPTQRDIIIIPALCYDEALFRIGHGAGYYDRYLADCKAVKIGLCREKLICNAVPRTAWDLSADLLLTEIKLRNR